VRAYDANVGYGRTDGIMSNAKITNSPASNDPVALAARDKGAVTRAIKPPEVEELAIDDNDDFGGDPYNHTGSHAVPNFDD
jgi:hypothetical protein